MVPSTKGRLAARPALASWKACSQYFVERHSSTEPLWWSWAFVRPNPRQPRPEDPVPALELKPFGVGTAENRELLTEGKVLQNEVLAGANQRTQASEAGDEDGKHGGFCPDQDLFPHIVTPPA